MRESEKKEVVRVPAPFEPPESGSREALREKVGVIIGGRFDPEQSFEGPILRDRSLRVVGSRFAQFLDVGEIEGPAFLPINVQQVAEIVRSEVSKAYLNRSFDLSDMQKSVYALHERVGQLGDALNKFHHGMTTQLTDLAQRLPATSAKEGKEATAILTDDETKGVKAEEFVSDLAGYYRKEASIVIWVTIAFLLGLTLLLIS